MKLHFKPYPGLTISAVIALIILITLGTWQYQRLQWKTAFLAEIDQVADAAPFTSLREVQKALDAGNPIDFRRYGSAEHDMDVDPIYLVFTSENRDVSWRVFNPVENTGVKAFADIRTIADSDRGKVFGAEVQRADAADNPMPLTGYIRLARPKARGEAQSTPDKNRWFGFNPLPDTNNWAEKVTGKVDMRFYIDTVPGAQDANLLPVRRPDIRNNHFDYMLTWYGLAVVLLVIYVILHRRAGRLGLK